MSDEKCRRNVENLKILYKLQEIVRNWQKFFTSFPLKVAKILVD